MESNVNVRSIHVIERFVNYLSKENNKEENCAIFNEILFILNHFCTAVEFDDAVNKIFENYSKQADMPESESHCREIENAFENEINNINRETLLENCDKYFELIKVISNQKSEETDDEIMTIFNNINSIDPITKLPLVDPVKNIKCGHIYEKCSILSLIKNNTKTKCPIPGCAVSEFVDANHLVSDLCLKEKLIHKSN